MTRVRPLAEADRPAVGETLALGFSDKMRRVLGEDRARGAVLLADLTPPSPNHFVADVAGRVAGVILFRDHTGPAPLGAHWDVLRRHLSLVEALRAVVMLTIFAISPFPRDRLLIDTLAVHPDFQGQGVAGALLRFASAEGQRRGKAALCLYVLDRNRHARAVYEHLGFRVVRTERTWFLAPVVGFWRAHYMERPLAGPS